MNNTDRFLTDDPLACDAVLVSSNCKLSRLISSNDDDTPTLYPLIPLNPRIQPVNVVEVIPV